MRSTTDRSRIAAFPDRAKPATSSRRVDPTQGGVMAIHDSMYRTTLAAALGLAFAAGGASAGPVDLGFPSQTSDLTCDGTATTPLGPGGGGVCFETNDELR